MTSQEKRVHNAVIERWECITERMCKVISSVLTKAAGEKVACNVSREIYDYHFEVVADDFKYWGPSYTIGYNDNDLNEIIKILCICSTHHLLAQRANDKINAALKNIEIKIRWDGPIHDG